MTVIKKYSYGCNLCRVLLDGWNTNTTYTGSGEATFRVQQDSQQNKTEQSICWMPQEDCRKSYLESELKLNFLAYLMMLYQLQRLCNADVRMI